MTFAPQLTPHQMLTWGVFGGTYFAPGEAADLPPEWFAGMRTSTGAAHNLFGVLSGNSREIWAAKGWLHPQDPLGWFQWYCRYTLGRRTADDDRQIARHAAFTRHVRPVRALGGGDARRRPRQRQAILQWAYDPFPDR